MGFYIKKISYIVFLFLCAAPLVAGAVPTIDDLTDTVNDVLGMILPVLTALAVVFLLWSIAMFVRSADNDEVRSRARMGIVWGLVALFVMFSLWGMITVLGNIFGVDGEDTAVINDTRSFIPETPY